MFEQQQPERTERANPEAVQRAGAQRALVPQALRGAGRPLPDSLRTEMEARLGHSFSDVRVHTDSVAQQAAASLQASAFTVGSNLVFGRGSYDTRTNAGRHLLAHELTHVVQQRSGPVAGTDFGDGLRVSHPSDRFERAAEANAHSVLRGPAPDGPTQVREVPSTSENGSVQRNIGAELEITNWRSSDEEGNPLEKKDVIVRRPSFELQADSIGDSSDIELVTKTPGVQLGTPWTRSLAEMETLLGQLRRYRAVMRTFQWAVRQKDSKDETMQGEQRGLWLKRPLRATWLGGGQGDRKLWVPHAEPAMHLQMTVGVPLDSVASLISWLKDTDVSVAIRGDRPSAPLGNWGEDRTRTSVTNALNGTRPSAHLLGFAMLLNHYLSQGSNTSGMPFAKGAYHLMARTDFAAMFSKLPQADQQLVQANLEQWIQTLSRDFTGDPLGPENRLLGKELLEGPAGKTARIKTTRRDWLEQMSQGRDLLTVTAGLAEPDQADLAGRVEVKDAEGEWNDAVGESLKQLKLVYEGLGALGSTVDTVPADQNNPTREGVILEIRNPQQVNENTWLDTANAIHDAVQKAIADPTSRTG
ncbi:eCIS core domain-containing protein [Kineosporia babensis]|uniref:DUF4157 domain-containing protein n=1 Tax=Kineosporia babensis TaxID=499548 RepID=A0A9X1NB43_9ACTN|nr:DUF4157 domain-containing protein [Kineosporia babensis]MCD5310546.1 DUF4157 domain-containing protein [Kineosporia babensis]